MHSAPPRPVPVPANLDVEEHLLGPLTARQCVILAITAAAGLAEAEALHAAAHLTVSLVAAGTLPLLLVGLLLALAKPGGIPADRQLRSLIRFLRSGRRQAACPPDFRPPSGINRLAAPYLALGEQDGCAIVHTNRDQAAVVIQTQPRCLQLADPDETRSMLAAIGTLLSAQTGPFAISTITERVSLDAHAAQAAEIARALTPPGLADLAAREGGFLRDLAAERDLWHRRHLITIREVGPGAAARAAHRAHGTATLLESCGISARILEAPELTALLTAACDPHRSAAPFELAPPDQPITATFTVTNNLETL